MDCNFDGYDLNEWQEISKSPFEEAEELPILAVPYKVEETVTSELSSPEETVSEADIFIENEMAGSGDAAGADDPKNEEPDEVFEQEDSSTEEPADEEQEEARKRTEHEASEAKRKAEWEAKQQEKKEAEQKELNRLAEMTDEEVVSDSIKRICKDTERLTRRNMKECVSEYVQTMCLEEADFARLAMHPRKNMINCFRYINRKAREYVEQEMKDNDIKPENGVYGSDVPDDLCYKWAEDYFRDPDAREDKPETEEKFVPMPYKGRSVTKNKTPKAADKKTARKKAIDKKPEERKQPQKNVHVKGEEESFDGQMSLDAFLVPEQQAS